MKFQAFFLATLLVVGMFIAFGVILDEFDSQFVDTGISTSLRNDSLYSKYNSTSSIDSNISYILTAFNNTNEDSGWKIFQAITVIPKFFITLTTTFISFSGFMINAAMQIPVDLGIHPALVIIPPLAILIIVVIMLVNAWRQYEA